MEEIIKIISTILIFIFSISLFNTNHKHKLQTLGWFLTSIISLLFVPYLWFEQQSIVQSLFALIGFFFLIYIVYLHIKKDILLVRSSIIVLLSGYILLVVYSIPSVYWFLIDIVAIHTQYVLEFIGYNPELERTSGGTLIIFSEMEPTLKTRLVIACTGIGSMALFTAFAFSLDTSIKKKLFISFISILVIYILNILRNTFIAAAYGDQWFHIYPEYVGLIFGRSDHWVSYYIADMVISQTLAVFVLIGLVAIIIKLLPDDSELVTEWYELYTYISNYYNNLL